MAYAHFKAHTTAQTAVDHIYELYNVSVGAVREEFRNVLKGKPIDMEALKTFTYPYIRLTVTPEQLSLAPSLLAYGSVSEPGTYGSTVTRPDIFDDYYLDQLSKLIENHHITIQIGPSQVPIPFLYAIEANELTQLPEEQRKIIERDFPPLDLREINDDIANSVQGMEGGRDLPLSLFTAKRVDYSLDRLYHYTGTHPKHFQKFILLTNYQRYIDEFVQYAQSQLSNPASGYSEMICPGDVALGPTGSAACDTKYQMPAYHLKRPDEEGITFINIGVGPSNAKTITDHLAVLRPHCWVMVGHCAGLRHNQMLGDYVLAQAYMRDDKVLDDDLPTWVPVPSIAEIQLALLDSISQVTGQTGDEMRLRTRTGTVATTCNRNWELNTREFYRHLRLSRAIAVDMESATIAANGFRFRVPYGTLLCVSDKPIHGEIKMRGMANVFYQQRVSQHLEIGVKAVELLRQQGVWQLHSRKLRGFYEVPFG